MVRFWENWKREILIAVGILVLATFLRIYNLTLVPVFADEAIYIRWAQVMRAVPSLRFLPLSDGKQPLFMWVVIPFLKIFSDPLVAGRMVSVLTGIGTLVGIFVLSYLLFRSKKISLTASMVYAVSPFSIFFDRMALVDSMLTMFGVWTFIFAVIAAERVRLDAAILSGFSLGGALLTKSPAIFFAGLVPTTWLLSKWPKRLREKFSRASVLVFLFTFTYAVGFAMYNILRLGPEFHMIGIRNQDYVYPLGHIFFSPLDPLKPFLSRNFEYFWMMGPGTLVILIAYGAYVGLKTRFKETLMLTIWGFLPIIIVSEFSKTMTARYIYFAIPYLFITAALSFGFVVKRKVSGLIKLIFVIFTVHALYLDFQLLTNPTGANLPRSERSGYLEEWTSGYGIKEVSDYIRSEHLKDPDTQIVVGSEGFFGTPINGLEMYLNGVPNIVIKGVGVILIDVHESLFESKEAGNKTYLVVNNTRFKGDYEELGLNLISAYDKAVRPDGLREELLFFEVD